MHRNVFQNAINIVRVNNRISAKRVKVTDPILSTQKVKCQSVYRLALELIVNQTQRAMRD